MIASLFLKLMNPCLIFKKLRIRNFGLGQIQLKMEQFDMLSLTRGALFNGIFEVDVGPPQFRGHVFGEAYESGLVGKFHRVEQRLDGIGHSAVLPRLSEIHICC